MNIISYTLFCITSHRHLLGTVDNVSSPLNNQISLLSSTFFQSATNSPCPKWKLDIPNSLSK